MVISVRLPLGAVAVSESCLQFIFTYRTGLCGGVGCFGSGGVRGHIFRAAFITGMVLVACDIVTAVISYHTATVVTEVIIIVAVRVCDHGHRAARSCDCIVVACICAFGDNFVYTHGVKIRILEGQGGQGDHLIVAEQSGNRVGQFDCAAYTNDLVIQMNENRRRIYLRVDYLRKLYTVIIVVIRILGSVDQHITVVSHVGGDVAVLPCEGTVDIVTGHLAFGELLSIIHIGSCGPQDLGGNRLGDHANIRTCGGIGEFVVACILTDERDVAHKDPGGAGINTAVDAGGGYAHHVTADDAVQIDRKVVFFGKIVRTVVSLGHGTGDGCCQLLRGDREGCHSACLHIQIILCKGCGNGICTCTGRNIAVRRVVLISDLTCADG